MSKTLRRAARHLARVGGRKRAGRAQPPATEEAKGLREAPAPSKAHLKELREALLEYELIRGDWAKSH
jgi:hypothetical protein